MRYDIQKFAERRKRMGFSQSQLANGVCTPAQLSQFERGHAGIKEHRLAKLCERIELTLDDIRLPDLPRDDTKMWKRPKSYQRKELKAVADEVLQAIENCDSFDEIGRRAVEEFRKWDMVPDELYEKLHGVTQ